MSSAGAFPRPAPRRSSTARAALGPAALRFGRSIGSPTEGHLVGGMHLEEASYVRIVPADTAGDVRWGLEPLVTMLERAARTVRRQFPEAVTSVGHLSREGGGEIEQHRSHESGRDADVGFFVRSTSGRQLLESHFVPFRSDGTASSWPGAYFDDAKNWAFVAALLSDPQAHVTHIFVAAPLRARLLAYAEKSGQSANLRLRAAEVMQQPHGTLPHDDHFHVRIGCPSRMSGCVENPALRVRWAEPAVGHGRRGPPTRALVTPAPSRAPAILPRPDRAPLTEPDPDLHDEPPPPALMTAPLDDVDG
jgi:penicillin-insensitive murein DD-endopeptidase